MNHRLELLARPADAALERILRTVRARGFQVCDLQANLEADDGHYRLCLSVSGSRDVGMLVRQLQKIWDVEAVTTVEATGPRPVALTGLAM